MEQRIMNFKENPSKNSSRGHEYCKQCLIKTTQFGNQISSEGSKQVGMPRTCAKSSEFLKMIIVAKKYSSICTSLNDN